MVAASNPALTGVLAWLTIQETLSGLQICRRADCDSEYCFAESGTPSSVVEPLDTESGLPDYYSSR